MDKDTLHFETLRKSFVENGGKEKDEFDENELIHKAGLRFNDIDESNFRNFDNINNRKQTYENRDLKEQLKIKKHMERFYLRK
jgi:hypothetical protein